MYGFSFPEYPQLDRLAGCVVGYQPVPVYDQQPPNQFPIGVLEIVASYQGSQYGVGSQYWGRNYLVEILALTFRNGQGVVGKALSSKSACFCRDTRQLSVTEYPFVPNARKFRLSGCFAICLRSSCWNYCTYTLEFFLPVNEANSMDPRTVLSQGNTRFQ
ncbi:hypothetical protein ACH5RR_017704 [Cinchona calisaya]|uniref:NLP1-9 GAF domain-containing protein n=1 Tax=Cinchona calisaya TaxID=153742 RepID=A0ABD2ZN00_9GENT